MRRLLGWLDPEPDWVSVAWLLTIFAFGIAGLFIWSPPDLP